MPDVINKVISLLAGDGEGGSDKDVLLKQTAKELSQNKYAKFYRVKQGEADPALAQYFYSLYKTIYPLQCFLKDSAKEEKIRHITLEAFLDKQALDIIKRLSQDRISERKKSTAPEELFKQLEADLAALAAGLDSPKIIEADKCYNLIASLKQFVLFDFCSFLKKFDPELREGDFVSQPKFTSLAGDLIVSDLIGFLSVLPPLEADDNWKTAFEILKYCKGGTDVIPFANWNSVLISLKDLQQSKIMEQIGKLASGNPIWIVKQTVPNETLSGSWLEDKNREVREVIGGIANSQKSAQISTLEKAVFGVSEAARLSFYTAEKGRAITDKGLEGYTYAPALNHLMAYIQEFHNKEIHELCDIVLIRGQWTNNTASRQMSDGYHNVLEIVPEITELDESLDDDGSNGPRLRAALLRVDRDKSQNRYISSIINTINEEALNMINRAVPSLIVVGKHFKMLVDDYEKKPTELIMNWKELALFSKAPLAQRIAAAYKKINYFVQLMILETKPGPTEE